MLWEGKSIEFNSYLKDGSSVQLTGIFLLKRLQMAFDYKSIGSFLKSKVWVSWCKECKGRF